MCWNEEHCICSKSTWWINSLVLLNTCRSMYMYCIVVGKTWIWLWITIAHIKENPKMINSLKWLINHSLNFHKCSLVLPQNDAHVKRHYAGTDFRVNHNQFKFFAIDLWLAGEIIGNSMVPTQNSMQSRSTIWGQKFEWQQWNWNTGYTAHQAKKNSTSEAIYTIFTAQ